MPKTVATRPHFWRVSFSYWRKEHDGSETEVLPAQTLEFDGKLLHERKKDEASDPRTVGEYILVRKGAIGVLDSMLGRMRDMLKKKKAA